MKAHEKSPVASPLAKRAQLSAQELVTLARRVAVARLSNEEREAQGLPRLPLPLPGSTLPAPAPARGAPGDGAREEPLDPEPGQEPPRHLATVVEALPEPPATTAEAGASQAKAVAPPAARTRVKLRLWKSRTTVEVGLNAATGEVMSWRDPARAREIGSLELRAPDAAEVASRALALPGDCGTPDVTLRRGDPTPCFEVSWVHLVGPDEDVVVEGDKILVRVNARTGRVSSVFKKWRQIGPTPPLELD